MGTEAESCVSIGSPVVVQSTTVAVDAAEPGKDGIKG